MPDDFEIVGRIIVDSSGNAQIQALTGNLRGVQSETAGVGDATSNLSRIMDYVWGQVIYRGIEEAVGALKEFVSSTIDAAMEGEDSLANLAATVKSTGGAAGYTADELRSMAERLQDTTRFSHDTIEGGQAMLLTFTKIGHDVLPQATTALLDLATKMRSDPTSAAIQLGKALNDPITGVGALRRVGVMLSDEQEKQVKHFMAINDIAGAQGIILHELGTEFGGMAEAMGDTTAGRMQRMKNTFEDVKEEIGGAFLPVLSGVGTALTGILQSEPVQAFIQNLAKNMGMFASQLQRALEWILGSLPGAFALFKGDPLGGFMNALSTVGGILDNMGMSGAGDFFSNIADSLPGASSAVQPLVGAFQNLFGAIKDNLPMVISTLKEMWGTLQGAVARAMPTIIENLSGTINEIAQIWRDHGTEIMGAIKEAWTIIVGVVTGAVMLISGIIRIVLQLIAGYLDVWSDIRTHNWSKLWTDLAATGKKIWDTIVSTITKMLDMMAHLFGSSLADIQRNWTFIFQYIGNYFKTKWNEFAGNVSAGWEYVKGLFSDAWDSIKTKWTDAWTSLTTAYHNLWGSFFSALESGWEAVKTMFRLWITDVKDIAEGIITGLINGIRSHIDGVAQALKDVIKHAIDTALALLNAKSPSKVFMEIGGFVTQGFAQGIQQGAGQAVSAISSVTNSVINAGSSFGPTSSASLGGINIYISGAGDPSAVAREVWEILNSRLKIQGVLPMTSGV